MLSVRSLIYRIGDAVVMRHDKELFGLMNSYGSVYFFQDIRELV